ncbi:MAG: RnfABCDGE type electron transport complex subunit G [Lachnospiraceae bacterium]|nr:RnfABCDGE type electron transport complex subunit G [Lachnospiraceae bacterium]
MTGTRVKGTIVKDTLVLFAITLTAAILLGAVYGITKEPIAKAEEESKLAAYSKVFEGISGMREDEALSSALTQSEELFEDDPSCEGSKIKEALVALRADGSIAGLVMTVSNKKGYGGEMEFAMGVDTSGKLLGVEFLTLKETAGLGMKADDESFLGQFRGAVTSSYSLSKAKINGETEIDAISGATVTTKAVTKGVNAGLLFARTYMTENKIYDDSASSEAGSGR